jgi:hypothetical protein
VRLFHVRAKRPLHFIPKPGDGVSGWLNPAESVDEIPQAANHEDRLAVNFAKGRLREIFSIHRRAIFSNACRFLRTSKKQSRADRCNSC